MLNKEREDRKKRKDSLTEIPITTEEKPAGEDEENSKLMMHLYDDNELKIRQKE